MCKQISSDSFRNKITDKLFIYLYIYLCVYNHLTVCKQMADIKLNWAKNDEKLTQMQWNI